VLGIDIGGTKTAALVVDGRDRPLARVEITTPRDGLGDAVLGTARAALRAVPAGSGTLVAVGVAAPGHVDPDGGHVRLAVNLGVEELPVGRLLRDALAVPCFVDHDARAAAAWLHASDAADGTDPVSHLAYLTIGTGIAAGIVLDGVALRGADGLAGEVGHVVAEPSGPRCACGLSGCLEAVAAGPAIERRAAEAIALGEPTSLAGRATAEDVYRAAAQGDRVACGIADEVGRYVARAVRALALSFGLQRVYIGGGVARAADAFLEPVQRELARERDASQLVRRAVPVGFVRLVPADADAVAHGAITLARAALARSMTMKTKPEKEVDDA
jgi:glucokinase